MRALHDSEFKAVCGGTSASRSAAVKQCQGLPDNTKVTFTIQISSNVGGKVGGVGGEATTSQTVTVETTCGDLRKAS